MAALGGSGWRWPYYVFAFACGLVCRRWPRGAPAVGVAESAVNLLLLFLAVLLPVWNLPARFLAGETPTRPFEAVGLANLLLAGAVFVVAFHRSQAALLSRRRRSRHE